MKKNFSVFIDGSHGAVALELEKVIREYNETVADLEDGCLLDVRKLIGKDKKNLNARLEVMEGSDITVLCTPDHASREIVEKASEETKIIDTSTAFRTSEKWVYGFAELCFEQEEKIANSNRVSNAGCYALGFIASIRPFFYYGMLGESAGTLKVSGVSGYSGGGKKLIELYEKGKLPNYSPYNLDLKHKHLEEMNKYSLAKKGVLLQTAVVSNYRGMLVSTAMNKFDFNGFTSTLSTSEKADALLKRYYKESNRINVISIKDEKLLCGSFLDMTKNNNTDKLDIIVTGNEDNYVINARLDNLGIGASRNALHNIKLMLGIK